MTVYALVLSITVNLSALGHPITVEKVAVIFADKSECERWAALGPLGVLTDSKVECRELPFISGTIEAPAR